MNVYLNKPTIDYTSIHFFLCLVSLLFILIFPNQLSENFRSLHTSEIRPLYLRSKTKNSNQIKFYESKATNQQNRQNLQIVKREVFIFFSFFFWLLLLLLKSISRNFTFHLFPIWYSLNLKMLHFRNIWFEFSKLLLLC